MALTNDWTDFLARLNADKVRQGASNFTTMEPEETDSSDTATYSVVFVPRRPTKLVNTQEEAMSKESTKAAFARATGHLLLNLSPEEEASLTTYRKSKERIRMEQQADRYPTYDERMIQLQRQRSADWEPRV